MLDKATTHLDICLAFLQCSLPLITDDLFTQACSARISQQLPTMCSRLRSSYSCRCWPGWNAIVNFGRLVNVVDSVGIVIAIIIFPGLSRSRRNFDWFNGFAAFVGIRQGFDVTRVKTAASFLDACACWFHASACSWDAWWKPVEETGARSQPWPRKQKTSNV